MISDSAFCTWLEMPKHWMGWHLDLGLVVKLIFIQLNDHTLYYLLLTTQDEIEVALIHNGTGYVALGWRPGRGIDGSCRAEAPGNYPVGMLIHQLLLYS